MNKKKPRIGFVSLGCPKALVDSERILTQLKTEGYEISASYDSADVVVINTCGFIDSAVEESLDAIGEAMQENGKVIVTGCLGVDSDKVLQAYPDVLAISGPHAYEEVMNAVRKQVKPAHDPFLDLVPPQGIKLTPRHYAYLKISEGCNHRCSFCIIPSLRGDLVSRSISDVMQEAENLVKAGVKELLVVSQDTSAYGVDIKYRTGFWQGRPIKSHIQQLSEALAELGIWVRLHYVYPYPHVDKLIPLMAEGKILPYLDIPFQHGSHAVLKKMRRPAHAEKVLERLHKWRAICPDIAIRSTFIAGFPGETEADFELMLDFLREAKLNRVGCFAYSAVEGAEANGLANPVPEDEKQDRVERFMQLQAKISAEKLSARIGQRMTVLTDDVGDNKEDFTIARSYADAPEIDGVVFIEGERLESGQFAEVEITHSSEHDLWGCLL
ncbi:MAG TPA: 30S ribosomal protein S12 methylthiotransferase RimO [Gammaproteobacteria bacterium]|nr:30S ribosomal protein S12 methylthiotransferase RimO [Gammaproteobacteria bacterium]